MEHYLKGREVRTVVLIRIACLVKKSLCSNKFGSAALCIENKVNYTEYSPSVRVSFLQARRKEGQNNGLFSIAFYHITAG
jgi:hypothetical protein